MFKATLSIATLLAVFITTLTVANAGESKRTALILKGVVTCADAPLADVQVVVKHNGQTVWSARTGSKGKIAIPMAENGTYLVQFERPGHIKKQLLVQTADLHQQGHKGSFTFCIDLFKLVQYDPASETFYTTAEISWNKRRKSYVHNTSFTDQALHQVRQFKHNRQYTAHRNKPQP